MKTSKSTKPVRLAGIAAAVGVAAALTAGVSATANAAEIKMAFFASPKHHVWDKFMAPWGKELEAANIGIKVLGFPGSQIGGKPPGAFKRVVNGIADVEFGLQGYTSTVFPKTMIAEIPMQFANAEEATRGLWRIFDKYLKDEYPRTKVLGLWTTDTPVLMTNKVVKVPADLAGVKLRTPSRDQAEIIKSLGAIPVAMPMPATYTAVEKGVVDGALVGISVVKGFKLAEGLLAPVRRHEPEDVRQPDAGTAQGDRREHRPQLVAACREAVRSRATGGPEAGEGA